MKNKITTPSSLVTTYIRVVSQACPDKKTWQDEMHCNNVLGLAKAILEHGKPRKQVDIFELEQLRLDCTMNDKKRSKECLMLFNGIMGTPLPTSIIEALKKPE